MPSIGPLEFAVIAIIALMVFGPKRLPELGKSLGSGMRSFKSSLTGDEEKEEVREALEAVQASRSAE